MAHIHHEELNAVSGEDLRAIGKDEIPLPLSQEYIKKLEEQEEQSNEATNDNCLIMNWT